MANGSVKLLPFQHELDRPAHEPRRQNSKNLRPGDQALAAKAAAQERAANLNLLGGNPEETRNAPQCHGEALARRIDDEGVALPCDYDRVGLHGVVVLERSLVGGVDTACRCREARLDIATPHFGWIADADDGWNEAFTSVQAQAGRLRL